MKSLLSGEKMETRKRILPVSNGKVQILVIKLLKFFIPGAGNWLKRRKTILCSNQTSLQGTGLFWVTRDRGGEKNTRWSHSYLKGWADGRNLWLNFGKHGLLCKVIPTLHLHSFQDTGCACGCFLRSCMLTLESTKFQTQTAITYYSDFLSSTL